MDTYTTNEKVYVKIIDYKTGNTSFQLLNLYHGLQLQLVVYLNAALEVTAKKYPQKTAVPAGIFYYHVDDPYAEGRAEMSEKEIGEEILQRLKLDGIVNSEEDVWRAMDTEMESESHVIPVKLKKDGTISATSKTLSETAFSNVGAFATEKIKELGNGRLGGNIAAEPYLLDSKSGCDYCAYRSIFGFDAKIPGYHYHELEKNLKDNDILKKISEDLTNKGGGE